MIRIEEKEFNEILCFVREKYGIDLSKKRVLVECRLARELEKYKLDSFDRYIKLIENDESGKISEEMMNRLTTNYTYFFREKEHFRILGEMILPELDKRSGELKSIWCAGCAGGEEAYSIAMTADSGLAPGTVRIKATDISGEVLEQAKKGIYPQRELPKIPVDLQKKYCVMRDDGTFIADRRLRDMINFRQENLLDEGRASEKYDIIFCRNVMIYFHREAKRKLIRRLEDSLRKGGYLFVGHAELLPMSETRLNYLGDAVYRKE